MNISESAGLSKVFTGVKCSRVHPGFGRAASLEGSSVYRKVHVTPPTQTQSGTTCGNL
jgi:hypothetical protein